MKSIKLEYITLYRFIVLNLERKWKKAQRLQYITPSLFKLHTYVYVFLYCLYIDMFNTCWTLTPSYVLRGEARMECTKIRRLSLYLFCNVYLTHDCSRRYHFSRHLLKKQQNTNFRDRNLIDYAGLWPPPFYLIFLNTAFVDLDYSWLFDCHISTIVYWLISTILKFQLIPRRGWIIRCTDRHIHNLVWYISLPHC